MRYWGLKGDIRAKDRIGYDRLQVFGGKAQSMGCVKERFYLWPFLFFFDLLDCFSAISALRLTYHSHHSQTAYSHWTTCSDIILYFLLWLMFPLGPLLCEYHLRHVWFAEGLVHFEYRIDFISPNIFWSWSSPRARVTLFSVFGTPIFHHVIFYPSFHVRSFLGISQITGRWHNT
jgi:hypothetical protein